MSVIDSKLSAPTSALAGKLRAAFTSGVKEQGTSNVLNLERKQVEDFLDGYTTKLSNGEEATVSYDDIEKVGNFQEDFRTAQRLVTIDNGFEFFKQEGNDADRFMIETNLTPNLRFSSAVYRPGAEGDAAGEEFSSVTAHGDVSADNKAITAHLKSLRKAFTS